MASKHIDSTLTTEVNKTKVLAKEAKNEKLIQEYEELQKALDYGFAEIEFNPDGTIITANKNFLKTMGYSSVDQIAGKHHRIFVEKEDTVTQAYTDFWSDLNSGKTFTGIFKRLAKDGHVVWLNAMYAPMCDEQGRVIKVIKLAIDITEDKERELNQIRTGNQYLAALTGAIDSGFAMIEFDVDGTIEKANTNFLKTMGYASNDEIKGKHHRMFVEEQDTLKEAYAHFWRDLGNGKTFTGVFKRIAKDGSEIWLNAMYAPMKDDTGHVIKIVKIASDITTDKKREIDLMKKVDSILDVVNAASDGDLSRDIIVNGNEPVDLVCSALKKFMEILRSNMSLIAKSTEALTGSSDELNTIGQQMAGTAEETSIQSNIVSASASQVSQNIQTVAAGIEELDASIKEIAKNASDAASVANQAVNLTDEANLTMVKLGDSSMQIGNVVKVITSIAQQTNLLALNATIEAARAGEVGKGFAVVANEVKELAKETAKATEDISRKIETIQADTQASMAAITKISNIIKEINETQNTIASAVEEQSATTNEIGRSVSEASQGGIEISENILGVAQAAKDTAEGASSNQLAAEDLSKMAAELQKIMSQYTL